jgi:hypothetical protein
MKQGWDMRSDPLVRGEPGRGARLGLLDWLVLVPLFVIACTPTEVANDLRVTQYAFLLRTAAACGFATVICAKYRFVPAIGTTALAGLILLYFLAINSASFTVSAVLAAATIGAGIVVAAASSDAGESLALCLRAYLLFNLVGLGLALLLFTATGSIVDLHHAIFPFSESRSGLFLQQVRLSGFQIEPGTYANVMYLTVLVRSLLRGRLYNRLDVVAILSTLVTLSAWAVIGAACYFIGVFVEVVFSQQKLALAQRAGAIAIAVAVYVFAVPNFLIQADKFNLLEYFESRFTLSGGGSLVDKTLAFDAWWRAMQRWPFLGQPLSNSFCDYCLSPQDVGTILNLVYYFGIAASVFILGWAALRLVSGWRIPLVIGMAPLIVAKFYCYDFAVWIALGLVLFARPPEMSRAAVAVSLDAGGGGVREPA